ncbi:hypothetical protein BT63DRAFT_428832 [Microthyrium microscopicum]|uniref:DUF2293 domain-containing protein n=1 Tax=Microthyrium microscopicum TaxID=703497 RepID=A0A6A6TXR9_9PEZI|nr:hypothetical protein BT63DRAFT_428832 [Microthyrium microscopicum]
MTAIVAPQAARWGGAVKRTHHDAFSGYSSTSELDTPQRRARTVKPGVGRHKTVIQTVAVKKKRETYIDSYDENAPVGYSYLPIGFRKIKEFAKELCIKQEKKYYVVHIYPQKKPPAPGHSIPQNMFRHGWHFPNEVLLAAFKAFSLKSNVEIDSLRNPLCRADPQPEQETVENLTDMIKDLFPNIPENTIAPIVGHAFEKGIAPGKKRGRVGQAADLSYVRRIQLAVIAHIRHVHTDYDERLKNKQAWSEARHSIAGKCLKILLKWRGEDEEYDLEEKETEVIILDDEGDEPDDFDDLATAGYDNAFSDIEILGSRNLYTGAKTYSRPLPAVFFRPAFGNLLGSPAAIPSPVISEYTRRVTLLTESTEIPRIVWDHTGHSWEFDRATGTISPIEVKQVTTVGKMSPPARRFPQSPRKPSPTFQHPNTSNEFSGFHGSFQRGPMPT